MFLNEFLSSQTHFGLRVFDFSEVNVSETIKLLRKMRYQNINIYYKYIY